MKISHAKDLTIAKHDIINKPLNNNFHKSNRDNSFSTIVTCHKIPISSKKKMVCSNISKCSNDHVIFTTEGWEEKDVISDKEKQSPLCNVEHNKKMPMVYIQSRDCKANANESPASTTFQDINKSCSNNSVRIRDFTPEKELTYIECDNSFRSSSCSIGSASTSWRLIVLPNFLLPTDDFSIPPLSSLRMIPSPCNNRCYKKTRVHAFQHIMYPIKSLQRQPQVSIIIPIDLSTKKTTLIVKPKRYRLKTDLQLVIILVVLPDHDPVHYHFLVPRKYFL